MSLKLNLLESKKLLKEFNFLISDIEFKNEFAMEYSSQFEIAIKQFLREKPVIKELCREKFGSLLDESKPSAAPQSAEGPSSPPPKEEARESSSSTDIAVFTGELIETSDEILFLEADEEKIKKLFRDIVQNTHPDKVNSDALNILYNKAVEANKKKDLLTIYSICDELGIEFNLKQREIDAIKSRLKEIKIQQTGFERGHLWAWCTNDEDENKRRDIIQHFLLNHAPTVRGLFN